MSFLTIISFFKGIGGLLAKIPMQVYIALFVILTVFIYGEYKEHTGEQSGRDEIQAEWDKDKAARAIAESKAIRNRLQENADLSFEQQQNREIEQKGFQNEITAMRTRIANANRLRMPADSCGSSGQAEASGTGSSNGGNPATRLVSAESQRLADEIETRIETVFAGCRAAQQFIKDNGFAPALK